MEGCSSCAKFGDLTGGVIAEEAGVVVSHLPLYDAPEIYLGHLLVEPRRHVEELGALADDEARALGSLAARAARALEAGEGAEHVYAYVIADQVHHTHLHLLPRYPGTPPDRRFLAMEVWDGARRGDAAAVAALCERLRGALSAP